MTDSVKLAAEAHLQSLQDPNLTFVYSTELQAYTEGADFGARWQRSQDESEAAKVAAQRAARISELEAKLAKIRARHLRAGTKAQSACVHCDVAWPCEAVAILDGEA